MRSLFPSASLSNRPIYGRLGAIDTPSGSTVSSNEDRIIVSIDFGTTFSGVAYGSSRIAGGKVQQILTWPGTSENFSKIPTCLLYDDAGRVTAWGLEAKCANPAPGTVRCEWFKLVLEPGALRNEILDPRLPQPPLGKTSVDLIVDFLTCLWDYARERITKETDIVVNSDTADVWLTVPATWNAKAYEIIRISAVQADLGGHDWKNRLHIIAEPEAAAVYCATLTNLHQLHPNQNFMICCAGGGTVGVAVYKLIGLQDLEIAELCARLGSNCGSLFLDFRFMELVKTLLADHPVHLEPASLAYFMHVFNEMGKPGYHGEGDDRNMFHFPCFNVEDSDDPSVGLIEGKLVIPGILLRREVFDPVIEQVLNLIEEQIRRVDQSIDALLLVGGFSASEYLFKRVDEAFCSRINVIARPSDADTAISRGAAQYGLARRPPVSSISAPMPCFMRFQLPAEPEDWQRRPAQIYKDNSSDYICRGRLRYLVTKGEILAKGQRVRIGFSKFTCSPQDRWFRSIIYTSDKMVRYEDEDGIDEWCKWGVDLYQIPGFEELAKKSQGFWTDFELGLEVDSVEVRGVLLFNGQECGRAILDFLVWPSYAIPKKR
ncbi:actin-like ATPase domain-containing protein [Cantharellus anzutake]|uniref:actin-like ATPase domain-containing protein n=1 Tax=Cantharellus anzutake TaxID=1750568 RepID=UPI00190647DB|nr:actin-like ATPase domain-containing protein [Cantharellus anzutake]KAF8331926.1 actin-like ATPase domain-containing protein [Cantharellus anzutake]